VIGSKCDGSQTNFSVIEKATLIPGDNSRKDRGQFVSQYFRNNFTKNVTQTDRSQIKKRLGLINLRNKNKTSMGIQFF